MKGGWISPKASLHVMLMWFSSLIPFIWCITFINLWILNHLWLSGMKPFWSWYMIF
jgi:hypothetical protein